MLSTDESVNSSQDGSGLEDGTDTNRQEDRFFRSAVNYRRYSDKSKFTLFSGLNYNDLSYLVERVVSGNGRVPQIESASRILTLDNRATYRRSISLRDEIRADIRYVYNIVDTEEKITTNHYDKKRGETTFSMSWFHVLNQKIRFRSSAVAQIVGRAIVAPSFSAGGEFHVLPGDRLYLKASVSSNHRFPTLNDLYFQPGGNPLLRPENSVSGEAGLIYNQMKGETGFQAGISAYHSNVRDWIIWLPSFKGHWEPFNIEKVRTEGLECNLAYTEKTGEWLWRLRGNYAYTRSRNFGDPGNWADQSYGKQLPYIPLHSANLNLTSEWRGWSVVYTWNYYSERYTTSSNARTSYRDILYPNLMNQVRAGKSFPLGASSLDLSLAVYNLFNETYRSVLQRQMPGRNFMFIARFNW